MFRRFQVTEAAAFFRRFRRVSNGVLICLATGFRCQSKCFTGISKLYLFVSMKGESAGW